MRMITMLLPLGFLLCVSMQGQAVETAQDSHGLRMHLEIVNPTDESVPTTIRVTILNTGGKRVVLNYNESRQGDFRNALRERFSFEFSPEKVTLYGQTMENQGSGSLLTEELEPGKSLEVEWKLKDPLIHKTGDYYWDVLRFPAKGKYALKASVSLDTNLGSINLVSNSAEIFVGNSRETPKSPVATIMEVGTTMKIKLNVGLAAKIEKRDHFWLSPTWTRGPWTFKVSEVSENECICETMDIRGEFQKSELPQKGDRVLLAPKE